MFKKLARDREGNVTDAPVALVHTMVRAKGGWCVRTYTLRGESVVNVKDSEADVFAITANKLSMMIYKQGEE
jgi:hypothetical protein